LRGLFAFAVADRSIPLKRNPAKAYLKSKKKGSFHTWTTEEVAIYLERHGPGAKARLALGIILLSRQRRSARAHGPAECFEIPHNNPVRRIPLFQSAVQCKQHPSFAFADAAALMGDCFACGLLS
jgi:hypothetical protein